MKVEAEITGMLPQTKKYPGLPVTGRGRKDPPLETAEEVPAPGTH